MMEKPKKIRRRRTRRIRKRKKKSAKSPPPRALKRPKLSKRLMSLILSISQLSQSELRSSGSLNLTKS